MLAVPALRHALEDGLHVLGHVGEVVGRRRDGEVARQEGVVPWWGRPVVGIGVLQGAGRVRDGQRGRLVGPVDDVLTGAAAVPKNGPGQSREQTSFSERVFY